MYAMELVILHNLSDGPLRSSEFWLVRDGEYESHLAITNRLRSMRRRGLVSYTGERGWERTDWGTKVANA